MSPPGKLERLERLARLGEPAPMPRGPSRGMIVVFLLAILAATVFSLYRALAGDSEDSLNRWAYVLPGLMWSVWGAGEILYPATLGRLLRVLARLVFLPTLLALFLLYWYVDLGLPGVLLAAVFVLCAAGLTWLVVRFSGPAKERRRR